MINKQCPDAANVRFVSLCWCNVLVLLYYIVSLLYLILLLLLLPLSTLIERNFAGCHKYASGRWLRFLHQCYKPSRFDYETLLLMVVLSVTVATRRLLCSPTPKTGSPLQASKTQVAESQQPITAPNAADKDDKTDDAISPSGASRTKQPTPPRPRYVSRQPLMSKFILR